MSPLISIIMPAYNAERTIELALRSIRMQTIADQIEILVIDGGSTDATREIAQRYGATILENPHRLPEPAKLIGIQQAKGRYVVKQDTDEELLDPHQLERRIEFFSHHPQIRCIVCDEQRPDLREGVSTHYLCTYGDPFTFFVYRQKESILRTFKDAIVETDGPAHVLRFAPGDLMPIGDGATTMFDLQWVKEHFPDWDTQQFICAASSRIFTETGCCGCIAGDDVIHHTRATFSGVSGQVAFPGHQQPFPQRGKRLQCARLAAAALALHFPQIFVCSVRGHLDRAVGGQHPPGAAPQGRHSAAAFCVRVLHLPVHRLVSPACPAGPPAGKQNLREIIYAASISRL